MSCVCLRRRTGWGPTVRSVIAVRLSAVSFAVAGVALTSCGGGSTPAKATVTTKVSAAPTVTTPATTVAPTTATTKPAPATTATVVVPDGFTAESESGPLKQGDAGKRVAALQKKLKAIGHDPGPADGAFGAQTAAAVTAFQTAKALAVDGVVGPQTAAAIDAACAGKPC